MCVRGVCIGKKESIQSVMSRRERETCMHICPFVHAFRPATQRTSRLDVWVTHIHVCIYVSMTTCVEGTHRHTHTHTHSAPTHLSPATRPVCMKEFTNWSRLVVDVRVRAIQRPLALTMRF
mmetsp:Transcript_45859/g.114026  ORF Transcript_45859/g.114026 Transcript_45859/m.114026 type:complete len:121 (+) Transcript_45859:262-624(+)